MAFEFDEDPFDGEAPDFDDDDDNAGYDDDINAKIEAFEREVKKQTKILTTRKLPDEQRIAAAEWLGDSGAPEAIKALRVVYLKDSNPKVKKATAYALGQFKALDQKIVREPGESVADALHRDENISVVRLLEQITLEGKRGSRKSPSPGVMNRLVVLLLVTLLVFVGANAAVLGPLASEGGDASPTNTPPPTQIAMAEEDVRAIRSLEALESIVVDVDSNIQTLSQQFTNAQAGTLIDCTVELARTPPTYALPEDVTTRYPTTEQLVIRTNNALTELGTVTTVRTRVCDLGRLPTQGEFDQVQPALTRANGALDGLLDAIVMTRNNIEVSATGGAAAPDAQDGNNAEATAAPEFPTETPTITIEPTATFDLERITVDVRNMTSILTDVTAQRGPGPQLLQFWSDASIAGATDGCNDPIPTIVAGYPALPPEIVEAEPRIESARSNLNTGLALLQEGWNLFAQSCANGALEQNAENGLLIARTAQTAFEDADALLQALRTR